MTVSKTCDSNELKIKTCEFSALLTPADSMSLKSEPFSPPSPTSSSSSLSDQSDGQHQHRLNSPLSPPYSPPQGEPLSPQANRVQIVNGAVVGQSPAATVVKPGSIVTVPDLSSLKIPIPKVTKPVVVKQPQQAQPLIISPSQLAQLTQGGMLQVTSAQTPVSAPTVVRSSTVAQTQPAQIHQSAPLIIKTEPNIPMQSIPLGTNSIATGSNDLDVKLREIASL